MAAPAGKTLTGRCHCRSVHFTITVAAQDLPLKIYLCHCSICRYTHGAPCSFHSVLPHDVKPQFVAPSGLDKLTGYAHPESMTRYFCSTCGCHVGAHDHDNGHWYIASAIFDFSNDPRVWTYTSHFFTDSLPDGGLAALVPSVGGRQMGIENPSTSQTLSTADSKTADDTLLAKCHCGGVSFTISRPREEFINSPASDTWLYPGHRTKWLACLDLCDDCRLLEGTNVTGWMFVPADHLSPTPASKSDLLIGSSKGYKSSEGVLRTFCGTCGASVFYVTDERQRPTVVDVSAGILRAPEGSMAESWAIWRSGRAAFPDDGVRFNADFTNGLVEGMKAWGRERGQAEDFTLSP